MTVKIKCLGCGAGLDEIHAETGIPKSRLLRWPPPDEFGPSVGRSRSAVNGEPEKLPSKALLEEWGQNLLSRWYRPMRNWLLEMRGIDLGLTVMLYDLGYGNYHGRPLAFMFPVYGENGALVTLKERYWPELWLPPGGREPVKTRSLAGRGAHLYPMRTLARKPESIVVCEGELDALLLNQHGIPAVTSTAGTTWKPEWDRQVAGRRVAVMYDAGSLEIAERRATEFRRAGAREAWAADLEREGFDKGEDVTDAFMKYGWSGDDMADFLNESRKPRWRRGAP